MKRELAERELTSEGPRRGADGGRTRRRSVTVNLAESPLSWLHARGHLSDRLFDAGERLRADYERAQLSPSITMRWDPVRIKGGPDPGPWTQRFGAPLLNRGKARPGGKGTNKAHAGVCRNPFAQSKEGRGLRPLEGGMGRC